MRTLTCSADLGEFKAGQKLETDAKIIEYIRVSMKEGGTDEGITDEQILDRVDDTADNDYDDPSDREIEIVERLEDLQQAA